MARRKPSKRRQRVVASDQAQAVMQQDYPQAVKLRLRLLARGGRARKQVCLACTRRGEFSEIWIPADALRPLAGTARPQAYWTCRVHHEDPPGDEGLQRLLAKRR